MSLLCGRNSPPMDLTIYGKILRLPLFANGLPHSTDIQITHRVLFQKCGYTEKKKWVSVILTVSDLILWFISATTRYLDYAYSHLNRRSWIYISVSILSRAYRFLAYIVVINRFILFWVALGAVRKATRVLFYLIFTAMHFFFRNQAYVLDQRPFGC